MDAVKYLKEKDRLCNTHMKSNSCTNCIIKRYCTMSAIAENGFETAVAIVEKWSKEHPFTNADKFKEVFGWVGIDDLVEEDEYGCINAVPSSWWREEYKAPKEDE